MLEKPDIPDELIISHLQQHYELHIAQLDFLPLGADPGTAVYRALAENKEKYFLKLRSGSDEIAVTVPIFLRSQGVKEIIVPWETRSKQAWADFGEYKMILYPFIEGKNGFEVELSDSHRRALGAAVKRIHAARIPLELKRVIPHETFSPQWREMLKSFLAQTQSNSHADIMAARLAEFMRARRAEIEHLLARAQELASRLQSMPLELVLCHTDIHGGNILITDTGDLYIVDWDNPLLALKERDLMFIGGGIDNIWSSPREEAVFYEGYGATKLNLHALAYYRYERIIEDLAAFCEQLLSSDEGGADREQAYRWFTSNFEPGGTIEIAMKTDSSSA
jgi:spectinomycin phosphotransferase